MYLVPECSLPVRLWENDFLSVTQLSSHEKGTIAVPTSHGIEKKIP